jgi:hypothetical protein
MFANLVWSGCAVVRQTRSSPTHPPRQPLVLHLAIGGEVTLTPPCIYFVYRITNEI